MMTRRTLLAGAAMQTARRRPNLLYLIADDHAGYVLGADGNRQASTPHLDRLASEGTRFANHFCNSPVCTPSRQSLLTGLLPHAAGVTRLTTPLSENRMTLAKRLQAAGYDTAVFGKMHFNRPGRAGLHGFGTCMTEGEMNRGWQRDVKPQPVPEGIATKPAWKPFRDPARIWLNGDQYPFPRVDGEMRSDYCVRQALSWLEEKKSKSFALWVSLQEPHSPFDFPVEDRGRFDRSSFTPPRVGPEDGPQIPKIFRDLTDDDKRGIAASYYTSASYLDRNMGKVLRRLEELNLAENTLVVYLADHGYCLGHHGRFEKHCGYDPALRVPLLMRWPGKIARKTVKQLTEHVDLPHTIAELMDLDPPGLHGQSLLKGDPRGWVFSEYLENEEVFARTERWKYIFCSGKRKREDGYETDNPTPGRYQRLYDMKSDSGEFTDVAAKNPAIVAQMQSLLIERFRSTHPDADKEPGMGGKEVALEFYVRPRDVSSPSAVSRP